MLLRVGGLLFAILLVRWARTGPIEGLSARQTDDLLQRISSDATLPAWTRLLAKAPLLYRLSPIDLVPDAIPFIGRVDDKAISALALNLLARLTATEVFEAHVRSVRPQPPADEAP